MCVDKDTSTGEIIVFLLLLFLLFLVTLSNNIQEYWFNIHIFLHPLGLYALQEEKHGGMEHRNGDDGFCRWYF